MNIIKTEVQDAFIIEPDVFGDRRGWFMESWSEKKMEQAGFFYNFVQDNHSYSSIKGVLRGLHFQCGDAVQAKLVRCVRGAVLDVAVDLRKGSPTYMKHAKVELSAKNKRQFLIPRGFAHGFLTLTDEVEFFYKADNFYDPAKESGILWCDTELGIEWGTDAPVMSEKDQKASKLCEINVDFSYMDFPDKRV